MEVMSDAKATDHSHARFSFDVECMDSSDMLITNLTIENNDIYELALDFVELENVPAYSLNQKIVFQSQIQRMVQKMGKIVQLRLKKR